jgi:hypothetical protein
MNRYPLHFLAFCALLKSQMPLMITETDAIIDLIRKDYVNSEFANG